MQKEEEFENYFQPHINNKSVYSKHLKGDNHYISFIGAAFSDGQPKVGTEKTPNLFRERKFFERAQEETGLKIVDNGDIEHTEKIELNYKEYPNLRNAGNVFNYCKILQERVHRECEKGGFALTIGGDHSIAIGSIGGLLKSYPDLCVVWVDAHADINSVRFSTSGNMHGMPLSFLTGIGEKLDTETWLTNDLPTERLVYIGLRDLDVYEKRVIAKKCIRAYWADDVERLGIHRIMEEVYIYFPLSAPIHLSFDIDGLDQLEAPCTGTPVRGGLTLREGKYICESLYESGRLVGMDMVEVNTDLGFEGSKDLCIDTTINAAFHLVFSALGRNNKSERKFEFCHKTLQTDNKNK